MINRQLSLILVALLVVVGLLWFYSTRDSAQHDRKKALEERLTKIPFTADQLFPIDSSMNEKGSVIIFNRLVRSQITDSTLTNSERYLNSLIVGLIRTNYNLSNENIYIEIGQFVSANDAYGFHSQNRPSGVAFDTVGTESYYFNDTLHFTKSNYVVMTSSSAADDKYAAAKKVARLIESKIAERSMPPMFFRLFPYRDQLVPSQRYYSLEFLGVEGLDEVYSVDFVVDEDTLTLFLTADTAGSKFAELSDYGNDFSKIVAAPEEFEYLEGYCLSFQYPDYGQIVAFQVNRKLAGVVGYNRATGIELCTKWIKGLQ